MLEMLRRTRSTFRLDEEACEDEYYHGRCYATYMEEPKPRHTTAPKPKFTAADERTESKAENNVPAADPKSTAAESKQKSNRSTTTTATVVVPADPRSRSFKAVEVIIPVGLGILIDDSACGSKESSVIYCSKPVSIQTFPKNLVNVMISTCSSTSSNNPTSSFLKVCHLCEKNLRQDKDIFMYRGDLGFCSIECRSRQIFLDEMEESEMLVKAKVALGPRYRRRSVQIPQADGRRGVLAMS